MPAAPLVPGVITGHLRASHEHVLLHPVHDRLVEGHRALARVLAPEERALQIVPARLVEEEDDHELVRGLALVRKSVGAVGIHMP